jgi:hypothetical protein
MSTPKFLRPFWYYYGSKARVSPRYPQPLYPTIVEPFAGAAGYSLRHFQRNIVLVEKYNIVAGVWRYLITARRSEVMRIPIDIDHIDDLPSWVPQEARWLIGFHMNHASVSPRNKLSAGRKKNAARSDKPTCQGWTLPIRQRVADQLQYIRHWKIIEDDYTEAPNLKATWFIDPPYNNSVGRCYVHHELDYDALGVWSVQRDGQVIVCENEGADWLPFKPFATLKAGVNGKGSKEVVYTHVDR